MAEKIKKRKALVSDSDDEVLKKHKAVDSDELTEREADSHGQISEKCTTESEHSAEGKQNGKYEKSIENGLSDSDSAGTDVELTTDDESPDMSRRPKKKKKISIKSERRSRNNLQVGSSSESEDEGPISPKSPPSSKKAFRRRRTISGGKAHSKKSSDSESYKTDSESDEESQKQEPNKSSTGIGGKKDESKSRASKEVSSTKNKEGGEGSSDSEDSAPLQIPKCYSSSAGSDRATEDNEQQVPSKTDKSGTTADSKQVIIKDAGNSSDRRLDAAGLQKRGQKERSIKKESSSDEGKIKTCPDTTEDSEDESSRNPDIKKSESTTGDSNSDREHAAPLIIKGRAYSGLEPEMKKIKEEESSSDSESDSDHEKKSAEDTEAKRRSESPLSSAKRKELQSDSDSSSSKEDTKKEKRQKNKLPDEDKRIINLKKYLKTAGIRVHNYSDLWKDCRSNKARAQKLLSLLEQNGLKGRPTIEKCKKLRKKLETKREVEELDLANVLECGDGRTRRSRQRGSAPHKLPDESVQTSSDVKKRLRVFSDSDSLESD